MAHLFLSLYFLSKHVNVSRSWTHVTFDQRLKVFCQNFSNAENSGTPGALPHQKVHRPIFFFLHQADFKEVAQQLDN